MAAGLPGRAANRVRVAPFLVVGSDEIAVRLAEELTHLGEGAVLLARTGIEPRFEARLTQDGVQVLERDARNVADLEAVGLGETPAVAVVEGDDVTNLHAALAVHAARPDVRIVVRMFNEDLGRRLMTLFQEAQVVSASDVAAPGFLGTALHSEHRQQIVIGDRVVEVRPLSSDDDLARTQCIALFDPQTKTRDLFPPAAPGVLALVPVGTETQHDVGAVEGLRQAASFSGSMVTFFGALARLFDRRLIALLALITSILIVAAVVWSWSTDDGLIDSAYFAVTTITTTGYGDITPRGQSAAHKLGTMALMLVGALSLAVLFAVITDTIVGARLARSLEERPRPRRDHVVVVGLGRIGLRVIEGLIAREIPCLAVERDEGAYGVHAVRRLNVPVVLSDVRGPSSLDGLGLDNARCLMMLTDDDAANLLQAVSARARRKDLHVVLRLFDHDLAERVEDAFKIQARSVASLAAPAFAAALTGRRSLGSIPIGTRAVSIVELPVLSDRTVAELEEAARGEARVVEACGRWRPSDRTRVESGDKVIALGTPRGLARIARA